MKGLAERFTENPLLLPKDIKPSRDGWQVISLLNPGVFIFENKTWLLVRVAESTLQKEGVVFVLTSILIPGVLHLKPVHRLYFYG
jgi:predicted GH43/DUF377 family glycosyl hydrolase